MAKLYADELNDILKGHHERFAEWFGEMSLPTEEKDKRVDFAEDMDYLMYTMFIYALADYKANGTIDRDYLYDYVADGYRDVLKEHGIDSEYAVNRAESAAQEVVDATINHISDPYFTSPDRAVSIAENEGNIIGNDDYEQRMMAKGYTTKTWMTMMDNRVRHTHMAIEGVTIGIKDVFDVGFSQMRFPCDTSLNAGANEIIGCRCSVQYGKRMNKKPLTKDESEDNIKSLPMNLQFFAEKDIKNQSSKSLMRAIRSYEKQINEHQAKISNPSAYYKDWDKNSELEKMGAIKHWEKEVRNFQQSIDDRIAELKNRGDYNE